MLIASLVILYLFAPTLGQMLSEWPRLAHLNLLWVAVALGAEVASFACVWWLLAVALRATKWFAIASRDPSASTIQSLAVVALASVSSVPNVLEEMMKRVSSGLRLWTASAKSVESTFDTKRKVISRVQ